MDAFDDFVGTIAQLRAPDGCPWDRKQTHSSIRQNMIEEAYEALDAIERGSVNDLREELGDVLLQVVLQSQIAADAGEFTIEDVVCDIDEKIIRRHPHIFAEQIAETVGDVHEIWENVKREENDKSKSKSTDILESIPKNLPALMQLQKILKRLDREGSEGKSQDFFSDLDQSLFRLRSLSSVELQADKKEEALADAFEALTRIAQEQGFDAESIARKRCSELRTCRDAESFVSKGE